MAITLNGTTGVTTLTVTCTGTDAMTLPVGTTAQEPAGTVGMIRYNSTLGYPEWYSTTYSSWLPFGTVSYPTQKAIFGFGYDGSNTATTNLVSSTGVVATNTTGVGTARRYLAGAGYGLDKAIFGYGIAASVSSLSNLVSNTGVVATDTAGVGTARRDVAAAGYGGDKALFAFGSTDGAASGALAVSNLVSNAGVVATDTSVAGTAKYRGAAATYGYNKAIFGYGNDTGGTSTAITNLVSSTGVMATNTTGVGTARVALAAANYGGDKVIFGYGYTAAGALVSITNLVSNTGVVATDTTGVGTVRGGLAASGYGGDKAIFGFGATDYPAGNVQTAVTNLVSNTGVVATDTTGVGTARSGIAAASFSLSA